MDSSSDIIADMRISVVGAGVVGLTAARSLADDGHQVRIIAAVPPQESTSAIAAAIWYPYRAYPEAEVTRWSAFSYRALAALAQVQGAGVRLRAGRQLFREPTADPWWVSAAPELERVTDLPEGYRDGFRMTAPVIDMSIHLDWLVAELASRGVPIETRRLARLDEAPGDLIVNCSGLGARPLVGDPHMTAVRGQVVIVAQFGLDEWTLDESDEAIGRLTYVVPRERTVVLGGTSEEGAEDLEPRPEVAARIVARCARLVPEVARAEILRHRVGLRPGRTAVRLEKARTATGRDVIHCYGHGGAGVTLALGCAEDVAALASG